MKITMDTTLDEILKQPCIIGKEYMVDPQVDELLMDMLGADYQIVLHGKKFSQLSLRDITEVLPDWNAKSILSGLDYLLERVTKEKVFYNIWNNKGYEQEPEKKKTGLSFFKCDGVRKFVLICPGGGYASVCSVAEGFSLAKEMNEKGYSAFVLQYRFGEYASVGKPMEDLAQAIRFIQEHCDDLELDMEDYALMGFSAGAHLAASFGTVSLGYEKYNLPKPVVEILGYPVITMGEYAHVGSRDMLLGRKYAEDESMKNLYSLEKQITSDYPASYVWQCQQDATVPIENSKMFVEALEKNNVAVEYETFEGQAHGWGIGIDTPAEGWVQRAADFWENHSTK